MEMRLNTEGVNKYRHDYYYYLLLFFFFVGNTMRIPVR